MYKIFLTLFIIGCLVTCGCTNVAKVNRSNQTLVITSTPLPILNIKYFTTTNCPLCADTDNFLSNLSTKYPGRLIIKRYDLSFNQSNRNVYFTYSGDLKSRVVPFIVVNEKTRFVNYNEIINNLEPMITGK
jgi:glutaredoxin